MPVINIGGGRQTGRTTRMLEEAVKASAEGQKVYVVGHLRRALDHMREQARQMASNGWGAPIHHYIEFITPDTRETALQGRDLPSSEFWDHHAVEYVHQERLRLLHETAELRRENTWLQEEARRMRTEISLWEAGLDPRKGAK